MNKNIIKKIILILFFSFFTKNLYSLSYSPLLWEELVTETDFVGVVECEVAGGEVAKYKVIESWKGDVKEGEIITIRVVVTEWGPRFPIALCGNKYIVTAYKHPTPREERSAIYNKYWGCLPVWWRQFPSDYILPRSYQGRVLLCEDTKDYFFSQYRDLASFKKAAIDLINMSPEKQEEFLLRVLCDKDLFKIIRYNPKSENDDMGFSLEIKDPKPEIDKEMLYLKNKVDNTKSVNELIDVLILFAKENENYKDRIGWVLRSGGGKKTLKKLKRLSSKDLIFDKRGLKLIKNSIKNRIYSHKKKNFKKQSKASLKPSEIELNELREALAGGFGNSNFGEAMEYLTLYDPEYVVKYLLLWMQHEKCRNNAQGYYLGLYFAWKCGRNRKINLKELTKAKDDHIRVAAAVYLSFEDEELGKKYLKEFINLKGDPGVWAALTLVRYGDKSAMPRVLEVFSSKKSSDYNYILQNRILVLLSNSCKKSGIPMHEIKHGSDGRHGLSSDELRKVNLEWWNANKDKFIINDPWFAYLRNKKID